MRKIIPELTDELLLHFKDTAKIGSAIAFKVNTFRELVEHTAKLSYKNKDHLLFYRGQSKDYKNKAGNSTFYPSIYRGDYLTLREITNRFDILEGASKALVELFETNKIEGYRELKKRKSIQWSILQHYEVCDTPYTDFTHSLRVACSFATLDNKDDEAFIFVFGLPYLTNRISYNSEQDLINIRLLSICPPTALRPYFQEGYLVGTDDITTNFESKTELDFNNRLIAKFVIPNNDSFWGGGFHKIPKDSLYPDNDPIWELCQQVKDIADKELKTGALGEFLKSWAELDDQVVTLARKLTSRNLSNREAIRELYNRQMITQTFLYEFDRMREFRNRLVHTPSKISALEVVDKIEFLNVLKGS
jgi:hypothetical protein